MEIWKDIKGYEGLYQISNEGRTKSLERVIEFIYKGDKRSRIAKERLLTYGKGKKGHLYVCLWNNGESYWQTVHKLVAQAFIPNPNNYDIVHHIDHNPSNNKVENLMWMSNEQHYLEHMGERSKSVKESKSKKVYQYTLDGKLVAVWKSASEAAKALGISRSTLCNCCRGSFYYKARNKWYFKNEYKGYIWSYIPL